MRVFAALLLIGAALPGATVKAEAAVSGPVTRTEWQSVLDFVVAHGRVARGSCPAVVVARTHAPPTYKEGSRVVHALDAFLYKRCRKFGHIHSLRVGMTDRQVVAIAGTPVPWMSGPTCWVYRGRTYDALRVCFFRSRVSTLGFAAHG